MSDGVDIWGQKKWQELAEELGIECIQVQSKADLALHNGDSHNAIPVSAVTSQGLGELRERIGRVCPRVGKNHVSGGLIVEDARWLSQERQMVLYGMVTGDQVTGMIKPENSTGCCHTVPRWSSYQYTDKGDTSWRDIQDRQYLLLLTWTGPVIGREH